MNQSALIKSTIGCLLIFAFVSLVTALVFIIKGHAAPRWVYLMAGVAGILVFVSMLVKLWVRSETAARFADRFFGLKDGIVSARFLEDESVVNRLQRSWVEKKIEGCDPKKIPLNFSKKLAVIAGVLSLGAISMSFIPASPEMIAKKQEEQETYRRSKEAIAEIKKVVEEMEKDLTDEEQEEVDMAEVRKMVDQLEPNSQKESISRQFAKLEQKTREVSKSLEQKKDEEALKKAIKELETANSIDAKELAEKLKKGEMEDVKAELKKLKPEELKSADKNPKKLTKKELEEMRKKLEKMRDITKRLAAAAQKNKSSKNEQNGKENKQGQLGKQGKEGEMAKGAEAGKAGQQAQDLDAQMAELDEQAKKLEQLLQELELVEMRDGEMDAGEFDEEAKQFGKMAGQMGDKLQKMKAKMNARSRMQGLSKKMSKAQAFASGQKQSMGQSQSSMAAAGQGQQPGQGLKPGTANVDERKTPGDELNNQGIQEHLTGQKGDGPSNSKIEEAQSGTGVSSNRTTAKAQDFSRQMESFIERDSVPEDLKQGVKQYFKTVHDIEEEQ